MLRRDGLHALLQRVTNEPIIANLGGATFELYAEQDRDANLYTWGAMGLASSIGLGVALAATDRKVFVADGDGSILMNLGSLATIARQHPVNLIHIIWDNHQWAETGGQPTHTATGTDLAGMARAAGIPKVATVSTLEHFEEVLDEAIESDGPWCIVVDTNDGPKAPRPSMAVEENLLKFRRTFG